ncbi:MAG: hypothetical protein ACRD5R_16685 [Candidatus Acidiferrales bacterium]
MKGAGAVTRAPRPQQRQVALRELTDCLLDAYDFVSRRAYEKFQCRGGANDAESAALHEEWLRAESEIAGRMDVQIENAADYVSALATLPGYTAAEVEIGIESRWLVILGSRKSGEKSGAKTGESGAPGVPEFQKESRKRQVIEYLPDPVTDVYVQPGAENDCGVYAGDAPGSLPRQIFSVVELPAEVDPSRSRAVMASGLLGVRMPKKNCRAR